MNPTPLFRGFIALAPIGKGRPRATVRGRRATLYTPKKTADWEKEAKRQLRAQWKFKPIDFRCCIIVKAHHPRPKTRPKSVDKAEWKSGQPIPRIAKPDIDNEVKIVLDAAVMAGVIEDDRFVVKLDAETLYAAPGQIPGVWLEIYEYTFTNIPTVQGDLL